MFTFVIGLHFLDIYYNESGPLFLQKIDEAKLNKEKDVDYLSSIEVIYLTNLSVFGSTLVCLLWGFFFLCFDVSLPLMEIYVLMWQVLVIDHADVITMQVIV